MKKKKYGWPKRCLSLMCVLVLISMIILQSVPVTYASSDPDAFTSEPEENLQTISISEIPADDNTQTGNQLADGIFSEGNSDILQENPGEDNSGILPDSPVEGNQDGTPESIAATVLTGDYAKDITAIARTQLGVRENKDNFIEAEDGTAHCYSRYGQWAGDAYEEWSAAFVNFCAYYANIPQQYLTKSEKAAQWIQQMDAMSLHISKEEYMPKEGDIVFFLVNEHAEGNSQIQTDTPAHVGIVTTVDEQYLYTIEGNCGGTVQEEKYTLDSDNIYGYLDMDQVKKEAGELPGEPQPTEEAVPTPENDDIEQNEDKQNNEKEKRSLIWNNEDVTVEVSEITENALKDGTKLEVIPIEKNDEATVEQYAIVEEQLKKKAETENYNVSGFLAYDIRLINADGEEYEPDGDVKVSLMYNQPVLPEKVVETLKRQAEFMSDEEENTDMAAGITYAENEADKLFNNCKRKLDVTVIHFRENESGDLEEVVNLADDTVVNGSIEKIDMSEPYKAVNDIEFITNTFSVYSITWNSREDNITDVEGSKVTKADYEKYIEDVEKSVETNSDTNCAITDWKKTSKDSCKNISSNFLSESADENENINWWNEVSSLPVNVGNTNDQNDPCYPDDPASVWDGSRKSKHDANVHFGDDEITVYGQKLYDSATWAYQDYGQTFYRFSGSFNIGEGDPNDYSYTVQQVTGNDRLYINDNVWVFIYPEGTDITQANYMDYLAFWSGTSNKNGEVYFNGRKGTKAIQEEEKNRTLSHLTDGWYTESITDNAGAIIQSLYNKGITDRKYKIDIFVSDYAAGGGTYRFTVNKQYVNKTEVSFLKTNADGTIVLPGAEFTLIDSSQARKYTEVSNEQGIVSFKVLDGNYIMTETKAPDGYRKSGKRWLVEVSNGIFKIKNRDGSAEISQNANGQYYITNALSNHIDTKKSLSHEKYIKYNPDTDDYDLTLNVSGAAGASTPQYDMDVLFIVDRSGSMNNKMGQSTRAGVLHDAATNAIDTLESKNNVNARYAVVTFNRNVAAFTDWTENAESAKATIPLSGVYNTATNYEAALKKAKEMLEKTDSTKVVIFISDGDPTMSDTSGGSGSSYNEQYMTDACDVLEEMDMDYFYTVGVGPQNSYQHLSSMITSAPCSEKASYVGDNAQNLSNAFDQIIKNATQLLCSKVTITDTLSEYAEFTDDSEPEIIVKDENGNQVTELKKGDSFYEVSEIIMAAKDVNQKEIKLKFDPGYQLEPDYTYYVKTKIKATSKAYEDYENRNGYFDEEKHEILGESFTDENTGTAENPSKPGSDTVNTGTSSGKQGFHSNNSAKVTYTYNGVEKEENYKHPVIQINPAKLEKQITFTKVWKDGNDYKKTRKDTIGLRIQYCQKNAGTDENWHDYTGRYCIGEKVYDGGNGDTPATFTMSSSDESDSDHSDKWTVTVSKLPVRLAVEGNLVNVKYRIVEMDVPEGYTMAQISDTEIVNALNWRIVKRDSETKHGLKGAVFELKDNTGIIATGTSEEMSDSTVSGEVVWKFDNDRNITKFSDLADDEIYTLTETRAPSGYVSHRNTWALTFKDGILINADNGASIERDKTSNEVICYIENSKTYELPDTGSSGIYLFTISGVVFMTAALLLFINNKRKEETEIRQ